MKNTEKTNVLQFPHPVLKSKKLKRNKIKEVIVLDQKFVLFKDKNDIVRALPSACPHRGADLAKGKLNKDKELVCPYHAWTINGDGNGYSPSVPKRTCKVHSLKTWDRYGYIWIANADVSEDSFPDFRNEKFKLVGGFTYPFNTSLKVVLDNFGEIEHAFQVHKFIGPSESDLDTVKFSIDIKDEETRAISSCKYRKQPFFFRWGFGLKRGDYYHNDWTIRFKPMHGTYHNYWTDKLNTVVRPCEFIITSFMTPIGKDKVNMHVFMQMKIENPIIKLFTPILNLALTLVIRYEIREDALIANYAPENPEDGSNWKLTNLDKQIFHNRKRVDTVYYGKKEYKEKIYEFVE